jgi:hypothetical protein
MPGLGVLTQTRVLTKRKCGRPCPNLQQKSRFKGTHYIRLTASSNDKFGKKEKAGKDRIMVFSFPDSPASRASAPIAGKSGSLALFSFSRTFRKIEISLSDNDPWGMIQGPVKPHGGLS